MRKLTILIFALLLLAIPSIVLASDITDADYLARIVVTENGTAATQDTATTFTGNLTDYLNAGRSDASMRYNGSDVAFMPALPGSNTWVLFNSDIGKSQNLDYNLYLKSATGGKMRIFLDDAGMTTDDDADIELSDNFTYEAKGYFDATASGNITGKRAAFDLSHDGSGNVTASILEPAVSSDWQEATSGSGTSWTGVANAYDGDTGTYASYTIPITSWSNYIVLNTDYVLTDRVRYWVAIQDAAVNNMELDAYYSGGWNNIYTGAPTAGSWQTKTIGSFEGVTSIRARFYNSQGAATRYVYLYELPFNNAAGAAIASVTAQGVSSDEHTFTVNMASPFFGMAIDEDATLPVTDNVQMDAPLWQVECNSDPFTSIDSNAYSWALTNAPTWSSDGYTFDGVNQRLILSGYGGNLATMTNITIEAIVNPTVSNANIDVISRNYYAAGGFSLRTSQNDGNLFGTVYAGGVTQGFSSGVSVPTGQETYIAMTYDGSTLTLYKNGSYADSTAGWGDLFASGNDIYIGQSTDGVYFTGTIRMVRIYDKALTSDEILQNYNAVKSQITTGDIYIYSTLVSVPDNANDLISFTNGVMPYVEYQKIWIDGVLQQNIEWEWATVLTDQSENGHDATPTYRSATSNLNVTAALQSLSPVSEADVTTFTLGSITDILTTVPGSIDQMYSELDFTHIPAGDAINAILDAGEVPKALWWYPFLFLGIGIIGLLAYGATTRRVQNGVITDYGDTGSLLLMCVVIGALLALFGIMNPIPFWPAILFWIPASAIMLSQKHQTVG